MQPDFSRLPEMPPVDAGAALADQAYLRLREAILQRRVPPGTRLSVPAVARRLGVSRSPAREAIARIAGEGLATFVPRKGAVVARITPADLLEIYELREVLEGLAARLAAARIGAAALDELDALVAGHRAAIEDGDVDRHMELDQAFHRAVRRAAGNGRLLEPLDRLQAQVRIAMDTTRRSPGGMPQALGEHERILAALRARDTGRAEAEARAHIVRLRQSIADSVPAGDAPSGGRSTDDFTVTRGGAR
ncbi:transcriptional regulator, GntR family [Actinomadura meyerae]|uniref:Transcriptional regulator, GntR family n=1 Tax=Actinomadura meyerae TaxID=240840 RepID=A0A239N9D3_9ACTN|nr:GntR family transcriptional regulator [Actinomadura meyerae]SNT51092.1 transcriptional regulator, GntR family [Actinomadura meyerae]